MASFGRLDRLARLALAAVVAVLGSTAEAAGAGLLPAETAQPLVDPMQSEAMRADARLAEVCFVDARHGWAVGDRGAIWHTKDGGETWALQPSGVACRLESVCFLTEKTGWAAGGFVHPYTHTSTGVIVTTDDGGRHWTPVPKLLLPALARVRFFDDRRGWAIGCSSAMFPSGVFTTEDGGRSWSPVPGHKAVGWVTGDLLGPVHGILADRTGMAATIRRGGIEPAATPRFGLRGIGRMLLVRGVEPQLFGWIVGQGGLVMATGDLGKTWQSPPGQLPDGAATEFDFAALAVLGPNVWVAGSPGTRVLHSPDAGHTWSAFSTGQSLPIRSLAFADPQHGWAVGELGTILATDDGGRSWRRQRSGGTRAALLGLFAEPSDVPLELFARLSGDEGYLGAVETLGRRDLEVAPTDEVLPVHRLHEALVAVGGSSARQGWRFPLRQAGLRPDSDQIVEGWNRANDGRALRELEAYVVRQVRTWRPEVVVTHDTDPKGDDPLAELIHRVVLDGVRRAGDPTSYPGQITQAGLEPWQVKKVYGSLPPGVHGAVNLSTAELAERLGRSLAEIASEPRGLLDDDLAFAPSTLGFRLLVDNLPRPVDRPDFFSGIVLHAGGEARRRLLELPPGALDALRRAAEKRRNMQAVLARTHRDPQGGTQLLAQVGEMTRGLEPGSSAQLLYDLGRRYYGAGQWPLAARVFALLVERHPEHALARAAQVWLVQYYASGEAAWRVEGTQRVAVQQAATRAVVFPEVEAAGRDVVPADHVEEPPDLFAVGQRSRPSIDAGRVEDRLAQAAQFARALEGALPETYAAPGVRFPVSVVDRRRGYPRQAERFYLTLSRSATDDAWQTCARAEQWLAEPKGVAPKPILLCVRAHSKPRLDGRLDDAVWSRAKRAELKSPQQDDAGWPASVMLAYDAEFLYLAIEARQAPGAEYPAAEVPRPRDPDLSDRDRVDLLVDIDRDYTTYYRLTIDHRGWPAEACWGDSTWNPTWFVASDAAEGTWRTEAAVPLDQLTGSYPSSRDAWAIGIQRTVPGVGFQSWSTPAAIDIRPEGFALLIFE